jgi:hypothetical protein
MAKNRPPSKHSERYVAQRFSRRSVSFVIAEVPVHFQRLHHAVDQVLILRVLHPVQQGVAHRDEGEVRTQSNAIRADQGGADDGNRTRVFSLGS